MSTAESPLRKPSLADTFNDLDRRMRIVEYGDPYALADARNQLAAIHAQLAAINDQITTLDQAIANLSGQLGVVHDSSNARDQTLYVNDSNIYTWLTAYAPPLRTWHAGNLYNYIWQRADWAVAYHNRVFHGQASEGSAPVFNQPPAIPAWPVITDPNP